MSVKKTSLEKISENYPIVLVDSCVLLSYIRPNKSIFTDETSSPFFRKYLGDKNGIYVTAAIFREYGRLDFCERSLLNSIESNLGVFKFDTGEKIWYNVLSESYSKLKNKFRIGDTDYDLLISGLVAFESRKKPVALLSNDIGILRGWKYLLTKECLSASELGFFIRIGEEIFRRGRPPKNINS